MRGGKAQQPTSCMHFCGGNMKPAIVLFVLLLFVDAASAQCDLKFRDSIKVTYSGDTVTVWDMAACGYCSSTFVSSVAVSGDTVTILQTDTDTLVSTCTCLFNICTSIAGLAPGSYTVAIYRYFTHFSEKDSIKTFTLQNTTTAAAAVSCTSYQSVCLYDDVQRESGTSPTTFALKQSFPNPFNPTTTIQYSVGKTEEVNITVYDVLGRFVQTLAGGLHSPGLYTVSFSPGPGASSGTYFCRMTAGSFSQTRAMILVR